MLQEDDDELTLTGGDTSSLAREGAELITAGDYQKARALLESGDLAADEDAAMEYIKLLHDMEDNRGQQVALTDLMGALPGQRIPSDGYLASLLDHGERCCLPFSVLEQVFDLITVRDRRALRLESTARAVMRRHKHRAASSPLAAGVSVVSLGTNCLSWNLPNRWGLRRPTQFVENFGPFCLALHRIEGVVNAVTTDFADYAAADELMVAKSARGHAIPLRKDRTALWNHNRGPFWLEDDCRNLQVGMGVKIDNFRRACREEGAVFALGNCGIDYPTEELTFLEPLQEGLRAITGQKNNRIIITNPRGTPRSRYIFHIDEHTSFFYCPMPDSNYIYFNRKHFNSARGFAFERRYAKLMVACLRRWNLLDETMPDSPPDASRG